LILPGVVTEHHRLTRYSRRLTSNADACAQVPVFVTSVWAIRRMSVSDWPGLADGGALWFRDLTLPALDISQMTAPMARYGPLSFSRAGHHLRW
jgi:hypothetical protein